ncbi:P-loop containing nucleoside triphosphate hydrolase protein [Fennellomyces sp. T-0311]|nr:P-loop containing nucleoside triphosphate hydrolase protein [Fennellomyces sp. T-0311]
MAPLQVIGASFGRTGTDSLRAALNILGYNTHHMREMKKPQSRPDLFLEAYEHPEREADWDLIYDGYDAAVDWPTAAFVKPLLEQYPNAKVLLTVRDVDAWYNSVKGTIFTLVKSTPMCETMAPLDRMIRTVCLDGAFSDDITFLDEEEAMKAKYIAHVEWVKQHVPPERLLVLELGEGWERLCKFLDKPVPNCPYPRTNSASEFHNIFPIIFGQKTPVSV